MFVVSVEVEDQQRIAYNSWPPFAHEDSRSSRLCAEMVALVDIDVALAGRLCQETAVRATLLLETCKTIDQASVDWPCVFQV
jgi:hypothetical protein